MKIDHIEYKDSEYLIEDTTESKSVRLDVYLSDEEGTVFDLEMQNYSGRDLPKRSRYYQSMIDIDNLASGKGYAELPDSYIVFICTFDPFKDGMHKYEFHDLCIQDPGIELETGASKVFINAKSREEEMSVDMRAFLEYLCGEKPTSDLTKKIASTITKIKANEHMRREYMQVGELMEEYGEKRFKEGIEKGIEKEMADTKRIYMYLKREGRLSDYERIFEDPAFKTKLINEIDGISV